MKSVGPMILFFVSILLLHSIAWSHIGTTGLPLDLSAKELEEKLNDHQEPEVKLIPYENELRQIVQVGRRGLQWVAQINSTRSQDKYILMSSNSDERKIFSMSQPKFYSDISIIEAYQKALASFDVDAQRILLSEGSFPNSPTVDDKMFTTQIRALNSAYELALRWFLLYPDLSYYRYRRSADVRGYHFLSTRADIKTELNAWSSLPVETQNQLKTWLLQICYNTEKKDAICTEALNQALEKNKQFKFYQKYMSYAQKVYDFYFTIQSRSGFKLKKENQKNIYQIPFDPPINSAQTQFAQSIIESTWQGQDWSISLDASAPFNRESLSVVFRDGIMPHANGSTIFMDSNRSFNDTYNRHLMAHEFGHVLGFADCYVEFYDESIKMMVNYTIDPENIMCSRFGRVLPIHASELKRVYGNDKAR